MDMESGKGALPEACKITICIFFVVQNQHTLVAGNDTHIQRANPKNNLHIHVHA